MALLYGRSPLWQLAVGAALLVAGHAYPVWLRFVGGKGVACAGGLTVALFPWSALVAAGATGVTWLLTRRFLPTLVTMAVLVFALAPLFGCRAPRHRGGPGDLRPGGVEAGARRAAHAPHRGRDGGRGPGAGEGVGREPRSHPGLGPHLALPGTAGSDPVEPAGPEPASRPAVGRRGPAGQRAGPGTQRGGHHRHLLRSLLAQDYPRLEIVVLDDCSTDETAGIIREVGGTRVRLLPGTPLPSGWTGKNWACHQLLAGGPGRPALLRGLRHHSGSRHHLRQRRGASKKRGRGLVSLPAASRTPGR